MDCPSSTQERTGEQNILEEEEDKEGVAIFAVVWVGSFGRRLCSNLDAALEAAADSLDARRLDIRW